MLHLSEDFLREVERRVTTPRLVRQEQAQPCLIIDTQYKLIWGARCPAHRIALELALTLPRLEYHPSPAPPATGTSQLQPAQLTVRVRYFIPEMRFYLPLEPEYRHGWPLDARLIDHLATYLITTLGRPFCAAASPYDHT